MSCTFLYIDVHHLLCAVWLGLYCQCEISRVCPEFLRHSCDSGVERWPVPSVWPPTFLVSAVPGLRDDSTPGFLSLLCLYMCHFSAWTALFLSDSSYPFRFSSIPWEGWFFFSCSHWTSSEPPPGSSPVVSRVCGALWGFVLCVRLEGVTHPLVCVSNTEHSVWHTVAFNKCSLGEWMFLFLIFLGEGSACPFKYMSIVGRSFTEVKSLNIEDHFHSRLPGRKERTRNHGLVVLRRSCMDLKNTVLTGSSTLGNFSHGSVMTYMQKESQKEWICVYVSDSLCCTPETNTIGKSTILQ